MSTVRSNIPCLRSPDIESDAEILVSEIRPRFRKKLVVAVFYWPPNSNLQYIKQLKKFLHNVLKAAFEQVIILGDFNLPHID